MKGLFIVFEGIDGSGTSTQATLLKDYFINRGERAVLSSEPSSGPIGNLIREIMKGRVILTKDSKRFDEQMAYLFAADRQDHLYNDIDGVFKLIDNGFNVISTRYYFSSLAYNCQTPEEFKFISNLNQKFPNPNLVVYIDIPIEVALDRLGDRALKDVYETKDKLTLVSRNYQDIFRNYNGLFFRVDGTKPKDFILQSIVQFIQDNCDRPDAVSG
jgi:dTMP kinase